MEPNRHEPNRLLHRLLWTVLVAAIVTVGVALAYRSFRAAERRVATAEALPRIAPIGAFQLIDQDGKPFTDRDLAGKIWVAQFFFAQCPGPCPAVSHQLAVLQPMLAQTSDVRLVSISIDPANDTPAALRAYAKDAGADTRRWIFLTGTPEAITQLVTGRFLIGFRENAKADQAENGRLMHSTKVALVDRTGMVRAYYDGLDLETPQHVLTDIGALEREKP